MCVTSIGTSAVTNLSSLCNALPDVPVRAELLWQLAAVLKAQQPLWLAAGSKAQSSELQSRLVSAQHELLAVSGILKTE